MCQLTLFTLWGWTLFSYYRQNDSQSPLVFFKDNMCFNCDEDQREGRGRSGTGSYGLYRLVGMIRVLRSFSYGLKFFMADYPCVALLFNLRAISLSSQNINCLHSTIPEKRLFKILQIRLWKLYMVSNIARSKRVRRFEIL